MLLTATLFLPLAGALPLVFIPERRAAAAKVWALLISLVTLAGAAVLWARFDARGDLFQFVERHAWLEWGGMSIRYDVGLDGFSLLLILLTAFITPVALLGAWNYVRERQREFLIAMLAMETAMLGVFAARDLVLFYIFFEASLIPMYLIIGVWGGEQRVYATTKFVIYTVAGSLLMFVAILFIHLKTGGETFGVAELADRLAELRALNAGDPAAGLTAREEFFCFWAFALAFAVKVPLFPFHTWLPDAHVEAPTPGSVILAAVLLKMGGYGFLRFAIPFFPGTAEAQAPLLAGLAMVGVIYGSLMAFAQSDAKKLIAYSSVAHLGICMLGIFSLNILGVQGGLYQMLNHGVSTGGLFLLAGMLHERAHTRELRAFGGLGRVLPSYALCFGLVMLSSAALPLTNGFVGELACLLGAFQRSPWWAALGGLGTILGAVYLLHLMHRLFFGPKRAPEGMEAKDLSAREWAVLAPLVAMIFVMGLAPGPFFEKTAPAAKAILARVESSRARRQGTASREAPELAGNRLARAGEGGRAR